MTRMIALFSSVAAAAAAKGRPRSNPGTPSPPPPAPAPGIATTFDAMAPYNSGTWEADGTTTGKSLTAVSMPAKSTGLTQGGYIDPEFNTFVQRVGDYGDTADSLVFLRHDYSRRDPWNADSSRYVLLASNGWWHLYNGDTKARIAGTRAQSPGVGALNGPAGQCEWTWHATDPNKAVHTANQGGLIWYEHDITTQTSTPIFNLGPKFTARGGIWANAARTSFKGEGVPSLDWRYFCLMVTTDGYAPIGLIRYDRQLDVIDWWLECAGNFPDHISTAPLSGAPVVGWSGSVTSGNLASEQLRTPFGTPGAGDGVGAAGARVFDVAANDQHGTALSVYGQHSDIFIDHLGRECLAWVSFHGDKEGVVDGALVWCLLSDPSQRWSTDVRIFPQISGVSDGIHISGRAWKRPGWVVVSRYHGWSTSSAHGGRVVAVEMVPGGQIKRLGSLRTNSSGYTPGVPEDDILIYALEPQASCNNDLTRVMFTSNFGARANGIHAYQLSLPSFALPPAGLSPVARVSNPTITGTATQGGTLTRTLGTYSGFPVPTITGIWQVSTNSGSSWADVAGETGSTFVIPGGAANGTQYRWGNEVATQAGGGSTTAVNSNVATVAALSAPVNTAAPTVPATSSDAAVTTATAGTYTGNPVPTIEWKWQRNIASTWTDSGLTGISATLSTVGEWRVAERATNSQGTSAWVYSGSCTVTTVPTFRQATPSSAGALTTAALGESTPAGRTLIVAVVQTYGANPPRTITSVQDSVDGVNFTLSHSVVAGSGNIRVDVYHRTVTNAGARSATVVLSGAGSASVVLLEYSGITAKGAVGGANGTSTTAAPGSVNEAGQALYLNVVGTTTSYHAVTPDATFTQRAELESGGPTINVSEYVGTGPRNPATTIAESSEWVAALVTFI